MSLGMDRAEIESTMNAVKPTDATINGLMKFEKSITESEKKIKDASLAISEKFAPG